MNSHTHAGPSRSYQHQIAATGRHDMDPSSPTGGQFPPPLPPKSASASSSPPSSTPSFSPVTDHGPNAARWSNGHAADDAPEPGGADSSRRNPLVDLIDSEKVYLDQLSLVIRKVAAAWSRKDFPPPKLDSMFRCVEAVYRANRGFGSKLKDIGPNPSSPKALGDLLMRWIDDLEPSYRKYCTSFLTGFDTWQPAIKNPLLGSILSEVTISTPPTPPLSQWSLDALFLLPYTRLRYYRKLYARLLRSTKEGRSDHRLLVVANQRLEALVNEIESRLDMDVAEEEPPEVSVSAPGSTGERSRETSWQARERERVSRTSSAMDSSLDSHSGFSPFSSRIESRDSGGSITTSSTQSPQRRPGGSVPSMQPISKSSPPNIATAPLSDLELRIDTERTMDLFTMTLKKCKLQMNPPTLPYTRHLRSSHDVTIHFSPTSAPAKTHRRAHIFILSDLFIVAEWMEASEKAAKAVQVAREQPERVGQGGPMPEMWLCYPPLAGKHLMVAEGSQANVLTVMIMRKETFVIHAETDVARDQIMKDLIECIDYAGTVSRRNTAVPSPNGPDARSPSSLSESKSNDSTFPPLRYPSPFSAASSPSASPRPPDGNEFPPPLPLGGNALVSQMSKINLEPGETIQWQRGPSPPPPQAAPSAGAGAPGSLPPRQASLRMRQPSLPLQATAPQLPSLPFGGSDPALHNHYQPSMGAQIPRSASGRSVQSAPRPAQYEAPPMPPMRGGPGSHLSEGAPIVSGPSSYHPPIPHPHGPSRSRSAEPLRLDMLAPPRPLGAGSSPIQSPSARFSSFHAPDMADEHSPPQSPSVEQEEGALTGPASITAQMKCKVFLKQSHQQWKSLGAGKLKLYASTIGNTKQLVVESDSGKNMLISTIVLTDGVERVAKTGVAVEISDRGKRTGIIYMIQLRNENSAAGLFESLLKGSDRTTSAR